MFKRRLLVIGTAAFAALSMSVVNVPPAAHAAGGGQVASGPKTPPPVPPVKHKAAVASKAKAPTKALPARLSPTLSTPVHTFVVNSLNDVAWDTTPGVCETGAGNGICTFRAATQVADAENVLDKIVLPAGTINLTLPTGSLSDASTGAIKLEDTAGLIVWGSGTTGTSATIINGSALTDGVINVPDGFSLSTYITNLEVTGGANTVGYGGGIYNNVNAVMSLDNVLVTNNTDDSYGGGVYSDGPLQISNSTISNNTCTACYAGGVYADSTSGVVLTNDWFTGNNASGNDGGGVYSNGLITASQTHFTGNTAAGLGGGVYAQSDSSFDWCTFANNTAASDGGGVWAQDGNISATNSTFTGNAADDGGAIYADTTLYANLDSFVGNTAGASGEGGGIYNDEGGTVTNSTFTSNTALDGGGYWNDGSATLLEDAFNFNGDATGGAAPTGKGGGLDNDYYANLHDVTFTGNLANNTTTGIGGGIYSDDYLVAENVTLSQNHATKNGGGLWNDEYVLSHHDQYMNNSADSNGGGVYTDSEYDGWGDTVQANTAVGGEGGGMWNDSTFTLSSSTVAWNAANTVTLGQGGGIWNDSDMALVNDTIHGNQAWEGAGVWNDDSTDTRATNLTIAGNSATVAGTGGGWFNEQPNTAVLQTIFDGNSPDQCASDVVGDALQSGGHNLDTGSTCGFAAAGDISGAVTAQLSPLANNGGPAWTMAIPATSLANNAGGSTCPAGDERGVARPLSAGCSIGAYQFDGANERWVSHLYRDILGRAADTAGVAGWDAALRSGMTRAQVSAAFGNSLEQDRHVVDADYVTYLRRNASPADISGWAGLMQHGTTDQALEIALLSSPEYFSNPSLGNGNFDTWLNSVYTDVLHRPLDAGSQTAADTAHAHGVTNAQFATAVVTSTEAYSNVVSRWYIALLGRTPSVADSAGWVNALQHGTRPEDALITITSSGEYFTYVQTH